MATGVVRLFDGFCRRTRRKPVTITRIGATKKYADNWAKAFGKKRSASGATAKQTPTAKKKRSSTKKK